MTVFLATELLVRVLHDGGIMWGAYTDLTGSHMNAHANNFILLDPSNQINPHNHMRSFIAPIDFDMAYTKELCDFGKCNSPQVLLVHGDIPFIVFFCMLILFHYRFHLFLCNTLYHAYQP
jgi:hypothetical protein